MARAHALRRADRGSADPAVAPGTRFRVLAVSERPLGKAVLRDFINATIGFEELSEVFGKSSKSLMRMFGPKGNPQAGNLFAGIGYLQEKEGIHLEVKARKIA